MTDTGTAATLDREACSFTEALIGQPPSAYVREQYARAHGHLALAPGGAFDRRLVTFAASGPLAARAADAYARWFARDTALRRKLVVLTAILESTAPHDTAFDPLVSPVAGTLVRLGLAGTGFVIALAAGTLVLTPLRLISALSKDGP